MRLSPSAIIKEIQAHAATRLRNERWEYTSAIREALGIRATEPPPGYQSFTATIARGDSISQIYMKARDLGRLDQIADDVQRVAAGTEPLWEQRP